MSDEDLDPEETRKQLLYKKKCGKVKKLVKGLVYENAALCDEIASTQEMIMIFKEERKHLLLRVMECEKAEEQKPVLPVVKHPTKIHKRKSS